MPCVCTFLPFCTMFGKGRCHCNCCAQTKDLPGYVQPVLEHPVFEEGVLVHAVAVAGNPGDPFNPNNYAKMETI